MATIKERAKEIVENYPNPYEMQYDDNAYFDGEQVVDMIIKIATEQKQIDDINLEEIKRERNEYYDELSRLRIEKIEWVEKLVEDVNK